MSSTSLAPGHRADADRFAAARAVADAVFYEGNVLYPYRASAAKNQARWQFGVLAPGPFSKAEGSDACSMKAECILERGVAHVSLYLRVRCLQLTARTVEQSVGGGCFEPVASLEIGGKLFTSWDESSERELELGPLPLGAGARALPGSLVWSGPSVAFYLEGSKQLEAIYDESGTEVARLSRQRWPLTADVSAEATNLGSGLVKVAVQVQNLTDWHGPASGRDDIVRRSLVAVHILMALEGGSFVSLVDPPDHARTAVANCANSGCFPVLVGPPGHDDLVLASPIILYDHPEVAPESPGDMCDATEIDEILALRTLTLTEAEKREARATDPRSAAIVDRVDDLPPEIFARLHGAIRSLRPTMSGRSEPSGPDDYTGLRDSGDSSEEQTVALDGIDLGDPKTAPWWDPGVDASVNPASDRAIVSGQEIRRGARVCLRPGHGTDVQDMFLAGRTATVAGVFHDVDAGVHLAVTIDDDPAADLYEWYGRYRYFRPEELEVIKDEPK